MTHEDADYIRHLLDKAQRTLGEAKSLLDLGYTTGVVNRLYYAAFYAVSALLLSEGETRSKHSGIMSLFDRLWVKTGRVSADTGAFYHLLFEQRQKGDYEALYSFEPSEIGNWLTEANAFVDTVNSLLRDQLA